jgi:hypothetical protein
VPPNLDDATQQIISAFQRESQREREESRRDYEAQEERRDRRDAFRTAEVQQQVRENDARRRAEVQARATQQATVQSAQRKAVEASREKERIAAEVLTTSSGIPSATPGSPLKQIGGGNDERPYVVFSDENIAASRAIADLVDTEESSPTSGGSIADKTQAGVNKFFGSAPNPADLVDDPATSSTGSAVGTLKNWLDDAWQGLQQRTGFSAPPPPPPEDDIDALDRKFQDAVNPVNLWIAYPYRGAAAAPGVGLYLNNVVNTGMNLFDAGAERITSDPQ